MKRFLPILIVIAILASLMNIITAFAGSASLSISGYSTVQAGKTYTYTYKMSVSSCMVANTGKIKVSGAFEIVSGGDGLFHDSTPNNTSKTLSGTVKVRVKSSASPGDKGTISCSGSFTYVDDEYNTHTGTMSQSKTVEVTVAPPPATKDPNATPKPLEGWDIVEKAVEDTEKNAVVEGVMEDDYDIPEGLLEKAAENGNTLKIDFGTYSCAIDPAKFTDIDGIKKLSLKLDFEKAAGLSEIAGNKDVYQLHFGHVGELPGVLKFTFKATENNPGDVVYLYYYYGEANIVEGKMKAVVDEDGMLTFEIYHCSSYFVTAEVLEGASSNFDTETQAKLDELNITLEEKQTELDEANVKIASLEEENTVLREDLTAAQAEAAEFEDMAEKALAEPETEDAEFSLVVLIAAVAAAVMLSILLTMLITRSGLFKRSEKAAEEDSLGYQPELVSELMVEPVPEQVKETEPIPESEESAEQSREESSEQAAENEPEEENKTEL